MKPDSLYQDLLNDFKIQNQLIDEQINTFEPLTASLRKPAAQRLVNKGLLILFEIIFYLIGLGTIALAFVMKTMVPFYIVNTLKQQGSKSGFSVSDLGLLYWGGMGTVILLGVLLLWIGRLLRKIRLKNTIINIVTKNIKTLLSQHLQRKAAIEAIEQRHFTELPPLDDEKINVNNVPNPGY